MLEAMRSGAQNIFVKILLGVLALSFVVWGVGDVFRGATASTVAKVGNVEISYNEFNNALRRDVSNYQQLLGRSLTAEQLQQFNIKGRVLKRLIDESLIRQRINDINFHVGLDVAKEQITSNDLFLNAEGDFDAEAFEAILRSNNINKDEYIQSLKREVETNILINSIALNNVNVDSKAAALYQYKNEERVADIIKFPKDYIKDVDEPSETDLVQYYQDNTSKFAIPEYREVTYITIGIDSIKNDLDISDDELEAIYNENTDLYVLPESRKVVQYLFDTESQAKTAYDAIKAGKKNAYKDKEFSFGDVTQESLPEDIQDFVFNLPEGEISEPFKSQLGYHLFLVKAINPIRSQSFEEVRDGLSDEVKEHRASEVFYEFANQIEDSFASGNTIEQVADKFGVVINKVSSIDNQGKSTSGKDVANLPEPEIFIPLVFETEKGSISPLTLLSDNVNYIVTRVDNVLPQRTKALDEVKGMAIKMWKKDEMLKKLAGVAAEASDKLKQENTVISSIATEFGVKLSQNIKLKRPEKEAFFDEGKKYPVMMVNDLFESYIGDVTSAYRDSEGNYLIAKLKDITHAEIVESEMENLKAVMQENFADDILMQYNSFLRRQYPIDINEKLLNDSSYM